MSRRKWMGCCLLPTLVVVGVMLIVGGAGLYNARNGTREPAPQKEDTRAEFISFGREFFQIAEKADEASGRAFQALDAMIRGSGSIGEVHSAFDEASAANGQAAKDFKALSIPPSLESQPKLRQSVDTMARSYHSRKVACDIVVGWSGDVNDQQMADRYSRQVEEINRLTQEGLGYLAEAANDNGISQSDAEKFLPSAIFSEGDPFSVRGVVPWKR